MTDRRGIAGLGSASVWLQRGGLAILLLVAYVFAWRPVRTEMMASVVHPVLAAAVSDETEATVEFRRASGTVRVHLPDDSPRENGTMAAPAGVRFLLPALILVLAAPRRPYWLAFWAGHLLVSAFITLSWWFALQGVGAGVYVAGFADTYLLDAYSLSFPTLILVYGGGVQLWSLSEPS
jgi:hypothetical protein